MLANLNSLILDFVARQKIPGMNISYFMVEQLPVLPPGRYTDVDIDFICNRVLELTYTADDLTGWARDLDYFDKPFAFNAERRSILRSELDAYFALLYGLDREDLRYVLDPADVMCEGYPSETFRVLKNNEQAEFGEYRTQRLVVREFDRMVLAEANGEPYVSLLNPPPGVQAAATYSDHGVIRDEADSHLAGLMLTIIQQAGRMPRRELTQALMLAGRPDLQASFVDIQGIALLRAFDQLHPGVFDSARLMGDRLHQWARHFEAIGVIRLHAADDLIERLQTVALPAYALVTAETAPVARVLAQATTQAFAGMTAADESAAATPLTMKQA